MPFLKLIKFESEEPETPKIPEPEPEVPVIPDEPEAEPEEPVIPDEPEAELEEPVVLDEPEPESEEPKTEPTEFALQYDVTSGKRYVDEVSTKTEFDKMLDELGSISHDIIEHESERFAGRYANKFSDEENAEARKYEAFLGGYISNAAMILYEKGYGDMAIKQLEQAKLKLEATKRLAEETAAIHSRVEENNDMVDLSDILGLFGDG